MRYQKLSPSLSLSLYFFKQLKASVICRVSCSEDVHLTMQEYLKISLILSTFGFLKESRPSEPFITDFLVEYKPVTNEQINQEVFPIGTYSYLTQAVIIFLITDLLRYKPLIILLAASGVAIWSLLLWTESLIYLQLVEVIYGTYCATEIAYFSYIYAKTEKQHYQAVTSHTRAAILFGRFVAALSAQLLVYFKVMNYRQLNYLTLISKTIRNLCLSTDSVLQHKYWR